MRGRGRGGGGAVKRGPSEGRGREGRECESRGTLFFPRGKRPETPTSGTRTRANQERADAADQSRAEGGRGGQPRAAARGARPRQDRRRIGALAADAQLVVTTRSEITGRPSVIPPATHLVPTTGVTCFLGGSGLVAPASVPTEPPHRGARTEPTGVARPREGHRPRERDFAPPPPPLATPLSLPVLCFARATNLFASGAKDAGKTTGSPLSVEALERSDEGVRGRHARGRGEGVRATAAVPPGSALSRRNGVNPRLPPGRRPPPPPPPPPRSPCGVS